MKSVLKKLWNYIEGINGLILILYSIFVFVTAVYVSEHFTIYYFLFSLPFIIVLSVIICPVVLRWISKAEIHPVDLKLSTVDHSIQERTESCTGVILPLFM